MHEYSVAIVGVGSAYIMLRSYAEAELLAARLRDAGYLCRIHDWASGEYAAGIAY